MQVTQRIKLQAPVARHLLTVTEEYCEIILLTNNEDDSDTEVQDMIQKCGRAANEEFEGRRVPEWLVGEDEGDHSESYIMWDKIMAVALSVIISGIIVCMGLWVWRLVHGE